MITALEAGLRPGTSLIKHGEIVFNDWSLILIG
jgi:hypothetical protein